MTWLVSSKARKFQNMMVSWPFAHPKVESVAGRRWWQGQHRSWGDMCVPKQGVTMAKASPGRRHLAGAAAIARARSCLCAGFDL